MNMELLRKVTEKLEKDKRVIFAYLYGSAAQGTMREDSDVDIAVFLENPKQDPLLEADISLELEQTLDRSVDVRIINHAPTIFTNQVLKEGILLFSRDEPLRINFEVRNINEYLDFLPIINEYDKKRLERYGIG
ncbi:MAG: Nucleotidyltransferase domain protein [Methanobacterium sp. PtaU1.Bin097]|jgi:predicted nucleotidyltransferase|nr:MAG: Nucleotidyltransferase domain protein [Methanobacterium sp. PtaU1.Bin097]